MASLSARSLAAVDWSRTESFMLASGAAAKRSTYRSERGPSISGLPSVQRVFEEARSSDRPSCGARRLRVRLCIDRNARLVDAELAVHRRLVGDDDEQRGARAGVVELDAREPRRAERVPLHRG